jgi:hypothetical protein
MEPRRGGGGGQEQEQEQEEAAEEAQKPDFSFLIQHLSNRN